MVIKLGQNKLKQNHRRNGPFPNLPKPLFESATKGEAIDTKLIVYSHVNNTHFHKKDFELSLVLKVTVFGTQNALLLSC